MMDGTPLQQDAQESSLTVSREHEFLNSSRVLRLQDTGHSGNNIFPVCIMKTIIANFTVAA